MFQINLAAYRNAFCVCSGQNLHAVAGYYPAVADYGGAGAVALHLGQHMAGEKDCRAAQIPFLKNIKEFSLHQRVEPAGRLVEDK